MFTDNNNINNRKPIRVNGKVIGYIELDCFHRRVKGSVHQLHSPKAWCISKDAFYKQILPQTKVIIIEDTETGQNYKCMTDEFSRNSFEIKRGAFEPQLAMRLEEWHTEDKKGHQLNFREGSMK